MVCTLYSQPCIEQVLLAQAVIIVATRWLAGTARELVEFGDELRWVRQVALAQPSSSDDQHTGVKVVVTGPRLQRRAHVAQLASKTERRRVLFALARQCPQRAARVHGPSPSEEQPTDRFIGDGVDIQRQHVWNVRQHGRSLQHELG
jgi:hypothetical protein